MGYSQTGLVKDAIAVPFSNDPGFPAHWSDFLSLKFENLVVPQILSTQIEISFGTKSVASKGYNVFDAQISGLHGSEYSIEIRNLTFVLSLKSSFKVFGVSNFARI